MKTGKEKKNYFCFSLLFETDFYFTFVDMGITNRGLAKIAALGGIFALGSAGYFQWKISKNIKQSEYFRLAFDALNESEAVVGFLGKPILFGNINLGDTQKNFCDGLQAKFHVPVRGPSHSGLMVFEASRDSIEQKWHLDYLELQDKDATKKLTVRSKKNS